MCIIVSKPAGVSISEETLAECFRCNSHGGGIAYLGNEGVTVKKGFFKFKPFYKEILAHMDEELLIHFRIQSRGEISAKNCHPFNFTSENFPEYSFAMAHNGTLEWRSTTEESDTNCFSQDILFPHLDRDPYFLDAAPGRYMLERAIGPRNKMVILRCNSKTGEVKSYIINRTAGVDDMGCWFSNSSYKIIHATTGLLPNKSSNIIILNDLDIHGWTLMPNGRWKRTAALGGKMTVMDRIMDSRKDRIEPAQQPSTQSHIDFPSAGGVNHSPDYGSEDSTRSTWRYGDYGDMTDWPGAEDEPGERTGAQDDIATNYVIPIPSEASESAKSLMHLGTLEKRALRRMAWDFCKQQKYDMKKLTGPLAIMILREAVRQFADDEVAKKPNGQLDEWILTQDEYYILGPKSGQLINPLTPAK